MAVFSGPKQRRFATQQTFALTPQKIRNKRGKINVRALDRRGHIWVRWCTSAGTGRSYSLGAIGGAGKVQVTRLAVRNYYWERCLGVDATSGWSGINQDYAS